MKTKLDTGAIANSLLTDKTFVVVVSVILGGLALRFLLPSLYSGAKSGFSSVVDETFGAVASVVGSPESQDPNERQATDTVRGVFTTGDRALSDIYDNTLGRIF